MYYIRRAVSELPFGIYVPASERSIPAFNKNLCIFIPFGGVASTTSATAEERHIN